MKMESFGTSDIGLVRTTNEDVWAHLSKENFFILADGMGGHLAGEIAASETVLHLCSWIERLFALETPVNADSLVSPLEKAIHRANEWVYAMASENEEMSGMGTTLCLALLLGSQLLYAHVGDSRIYRVRKERLTRLTNDHSLRGELIAAGQLDEEELGSFPFKNVITRAMGTQTEVLPDIQVAEVLPGDLYFLCTDGLTDCLNDKKILDIIKQEKSVKATVQKLVEEAKMQGGHDNITVLMFKIN